MNIDKNKLRHAEPVDQLWNQLMLLVRRLRREALTDSESWTRLALLSAIERAGKQASPGALAQQLELRSSNMAAALRDAEERGYIRRLSSETDRRKVQITLTDAGTTALHAARAQRTRWLVTALAEELNEKERATLFAAGKLLERLAESSTQTPREP